MLYFALNTDTATVLDTHEAAQAARAAGTQVVARHDFASLADAEAVAAQAGAEYMAIDNGSNVWPRFDVIRAPRVGDAVSMAFNGDSYPDGEITSISASGRLVTTSTGAKYYRRKLTGRWVKGGTWTLSQGHHERRNPSF
jgi:hypothetical protein